MTIRWAESSDLDKIARVVYDTSFHDPSWRGRYPHRDSFPSQFEAFCRHKAAEYLNGHHVAVYELPPDPSSESGEDRVVAFSCWSIPFTTPLPKRIAPANPPSKPFADLARATAFKIQTAEAKHKMFDSRYPRGHIFLKVLYVSPAHQRRGIGSALVRSGTDIASTLRLPVTLFATEDGARLYERLGFRVLGRFGVQAQGEAWPFMDDIPAMVLEPMRDVTRSVDSEPSLTESEADMYE